MKAAWIGASKRIKKHVTNMRNLKIKIRISDAEIRFLEEKIGAPLPSEFVEVMKSYAGLSTEECLFIDQGNKKRIVHGFLNFTEMHDLSIELCNVGFGRKIPFAFSPNGWHYCLSLDDNRIYLYRWTDHKTEDAFLQIADSFEEFINGLRPEETPRANLL